MMLDIIYKNGRGRLTVDLASLIPCSASDIERLISFVMMSDEPEENAGKIYSFISGRVQELKKKRDESNVNSFKESVNKEIEKYLKNAGKVSKAFNLPDLDANAEKIIFKSATVYSIARIKGVVSIDVHAGYTFTKGGIAFCVFKSGTTKKDTCFTVIHSGSGLQVSTAGTRKAAVDRLTDDIISTIKGHKNMAEYERTFKELMIKAGYMEPEKKEEKKEMYTLTSDSFTPDTVTINGETFPATYTITDSGKVLAFATVGTKENGRPKKQRIDIEKDSSFYEAAFVAAGGRLENIPEVTAPAVPSVEPAAPAADHEEPKEEKTTPDPEEPKERDSKQARGPVPEKTFIGSVISGNGWKIFFDGDLQRTRIIFNGKPTDAAKNAIENAGFYYSGKMNSWNKKLTFKAYRAALKLSKDLEIIYAA